MSKQNIDEIVDVDALEFADDIEEIIISDYSGEEEDVDLEIIENSQVNNSSDLKISSVISCSAFDFGENIETQIRSNEAIIENELSKQKSEADLKSSNAALEKEQVSSSYDSITDDEEVAASTSLLNALNEKKRRNTLRSLYAELWEAISQEKLSSKFSKLHVLNASLEILKKLTIEGRQLEYTAEICLQNNYRLKRRLKRFTKKKRKSMDGQKPGKVVTSRASI